MESPQLILPDGYRPALSIRETERAIKLCKDTLERRLADSLRLERVSAPLFVRSDSGVNDNLNGVERPVRFDVASLGADYEVVHSLAKWKRMALGRYGFEAGCGIYTDMNAIRRDEVPDNLHSIYVDQWDWEVVITPRDRTLAFLEQTVQKITAALYETQAVLRERYPHLRGAVNRRAVFLTSRQLEERYPALTPKQREDAVCREHGTVFIEQIGAPLSDGKPHDLRAPDYDDWSLNGDLLVWHEQLGRAVELSSMGIRVDRDAMLRQLAAAGCEDRAALPFHRMLLGGELPLTMGGGIGQSRVCMLLLDKIHIGEVQASAWPEAAVQQCQAAGVMLL